MFVTRHSKARRSTNQEFQVARYLTQQDLDLLIHYLTYVRPFTDMLQRVCYGQNQGRHLLFSSAENPGKPWKVDMLTKALKRLTKEVCGVSFGVQIYCQLLIGVTEKHVNHISRPFNRYDDKSASADIAVAFAWQSGHRPLQRGTTYGINAAYPDSLQPALLRVYCWASKEWQGFLGISNCRGVHQDPYVGSVGLEDTAVTLKATSTSSLRDRRELQPRSSLYNPKKKAGDKIELPIQLSSRDSSPASPASWQLDNLDKLVDRSMSISPPRNSSSYLNWISQCSVKAREPTPAIHIPKGSGIDSLTSQSGRQRLAKRKASPYGPALASTVDKIRKIDHTIQASASHYVDYADDYSTAPLRWSSPLTEPITE